ncbi:MAG: hypothetical protein R3Y63_13500 [Eubacteriales bacterium]
MKNKILVIGLICILSISFLVGFSSVERQHTNQTTTTEYIGANRVDDFYKNTESVSFEDILHDIDGLSVYSSYSQPFSLEESDTAFHEVGHILSNIKLKPIDYEKYVDGAGIYFDNGCFIPNDEYISEEMTNESINFISCILGDSESEKYYSLTIYETGKAIFRTEEVGVAVATSPYIADNATDILFELGEFCNNYTFHDEEFEPIFSSDVYVTVTTSATASIG